MSVNIKNKLLKLNDYLDNNGYSKDAERIREIIKEYDDRSELSKDSKMKIKSMCDPRYLGDMYIKEFNDICEWWNFLADIVSDVHRH